MNKQMNGEESTARIILRFIQHNPRHYIKLNMFGHEIRPCARCFGLWIGLLIGFILASPFWLSFIHTDNFVLVFIIAWLFAIPTIIDWSTVKLGLRKSNNSIRVITGFLQGMGIVIYFFVLPANIIFKIVTYAIYEIVFHTIRWQYHIQHHKVKL